MIRINNWLYYLLAMLFLTFPLDWILSFVISSLFHELCHILFLKFSGGEILKIDAHISGCIIETDRMEVWKQFMSILAGPMGSFSLLLFRRMVPKIAICGLLQGIYNLIPVLPLDGGRLLCLILNGICPKKTDRIMCYLAIAVCGTFELLTIWMTIANSLRPWPIFLVTAWSISVLSRKIPCKPLKIRVQ